MIPAAAACTPAPSLPVPGTAPAKLPAAGAASEGLFTDLLAAISSDLSATIASGLAGSSATKTCLGSLPSRKSVSGSDSEDQQNPAATAPVAPAATFADPLLLGLFSVVPGQPLSSGEAPVTTAPDDQNFGAGEIAGQQTAGQTNLQVVLDPIPYLNALARAQEPAANPVVENGASVSNAPEIGNENSTLAANNAIPEAQAAVAGSTHRSGSTVPEPVFTLAIRQQAGAQAAAGQQSALAVGSALSLDAASGEQVPMVPGPADNRTSANTRQPDMPPAQAIAPAASAGTSNANAPVSNDSAGGTVPAQSGVAENSSQISAAVTSAPAIAKSGISGSNSDGKPGDGAPEQRQAGPAILETAVSAAPASASQTQFNAPHAQTVTEYVNPQNAAEAQPKGAVTDLRLQIDGAANQHVNVRVMQQAGELRMSVHSNDPALAQSLRDHAPELAAKLEQHHYEAEMLLGKGGEAHSFEAANTRANLQQDFSSRQQGSGGGQPDPQNKQHGQQREQPPNEDETFAALLGLRS